MESSNSTNSSTGKDEVALEEMLAARERRVMIQNRLIEAHHSPVISFSLNIPGPVKVFEKIPEVFDNGCAAIEKSLREDGLCVSDREFLREKTGYEAFFCIDADAALLKRRMTVLEEGTPAGRLYDIDVIRPNHTKISREELGLPPRRCLLCEEPAHACSRSRRHSVEELVAHIRSILAETVRRPSDG